jgi:signal transduction histidine kinase
VSIEPETQATQPRPGPFGIVFEPELLEEIAARPFKRETWREAMYLLSTLPAALAAILVFYVGVGMGLLLAATVIGIPLVVFSFILFRRFARFERRRVAIVDDRPIEVVYDEPRKGIVGRVAGMISDSQSWRDIGWMAVLSTFGLLSAAFALGLWLVAFGWIIYPLWGWSLPGSATPLAPLFGNDVGFGESFLMIPVGLIMVIGATWACAAVAFVQVTLARLCLGASDDRLLRGRVTELELTREQTLSQQSTELYRIERDLHDGAQARLVALAMDLGMAESKFETDPEAAKQLVADAKEEAQRALQELRDLVRGIGPQILGDRGLKAALIPLAARSPIKVELKLELDSRASQRSESAAYFVTSEALANAIKHSGATKINVNAWHEADKLKLRVSDNGGGGADFDAGEGLSGLRARVAAVDGELKIDSPAGGPTIIDACLPFE